MVDGNNIHDNTYHGLEIPNYVGTELVTGVNITNNTFTNNGYTGVKVGGGTEGSGILVNYNNIYGNGYFGVESSTTISNVDATYNDWGVAGCPAIENEIGGSVDYLPYIYEGITYSSCAPVNGTLSLTPDISNTASDPALRPEIHATGVVNNLYPGAVLKRAIWNTDSNEWVRNWEAVVVNGDGSFDQILPISSCQRNDDSICPTDGYGRPFPAGNYKTIFQAYDTSVVVGAAGTEYFTIDNTLPVTTEPLDSPEDGSFWNSPIQIQGVSTDNFLTNLLNLFYKPADTPNPWMSITSLSNPEGDAVFDWFHLWTPAEGAYDIKASAVDAAGNEEVSAYVYNVTFDDTQPTITNVSADKDYVKAGDELTITADVTDASGINAVSADFSYNVGYTDRPQPTSVAMQNVGGSTYKTIYTVPSSWNEGVMYIRVAARDGTGGNWVRSNDYDTVIVDNTAPQIKFEIPENGSTHAGIISLKATCDEECNYINFWWRAEGEAYDSSSKRYHYIYDNGTVFEWDLDSLNAEKWDGDTYVMEDGAYYLYAAGKDLAGNWARTLDVQIIVDNTSPRSFFISPSDGGIFGGPEEEPVHIKGYSTDESANTVASTSLFYRISGETSGEWQLLKTFENTASDEPFNWEVAWIPKEDGTYDFKAVATDKAGNIEETAYAYGVIYDTTNPTLEWTSPAKGTIISGTTIILSVATDNLSGVDSVTYLYQRGGEIGWHEIITLSNSPYEYIWDTTGLELGTYNLKAVAIDNAANLVEITRQIEVAAVISGETWNRPEFGKITVNWTTDRLTSGEVVYDTTSHSIDLNHPNYGYANTSGVVDNSPKTTSHTVTLSELLNGITYYWRTVSTGSPIVISKEHRGDTFSIPGPPSDGGGAVAGLTTDTTTTPFVTGEIEGVSISEEEEEVLGEEAVIASPEDLEGFEESVLGKSKIIRVILWGGATLGGLILIYFFFRRRKER